MNHLVLGATGNVGSNVVRELLARNQRVRVLSRSPEKARSVDPRVEIVRGDLLEPRTLKTLFDGMDGAFLLNAMSLTESSEGLMAVSAAITAGLQRVVYLSVQGVERTPYLPHFGSKLGIEAAVKASGIAWTILRPNHFFQNDLMARDAILHGIYADPIGDIGLSRVDVRDIAELAAIALTQPGHEGKTYDVSGPRALTGNEVAAIWSRTLGREVAYAGNDLDAWEKQALEFMPSWLVYDLKLMFAHFHEHGLRSDDATVATLTRILGHAPRSFEDFAKETALAWAQQGAAVRG